jgi:quercetin dioxygenase-like cupin family protein
MEAFAITRVYSDANGDSHFEDIAVPLNDDGEIGFLSESQRAETIIFRKVKPDYDYDFHTAPARQYIILLDGVIEIETSLGEKRIFNAGDVLLVEDTTGKGHKTRNIYTEVRSSIFITL